MYEFDESGRKKTEICVEERSCITWISLKEFLENEMDQLVHENLRKNEVITIIVLKLLSKRLLQIQVIRCLPNTIQQSWNFREEVMVIIMVHCGRFEENRIYDAH